MFRKFSMALAAAFCVATTGFAQQPCATDQKYWEVVKKYPQVLEYEQQFEQQIAAAVAQGGVLNKTTLAASDTTTFDVPLVVHVVHDYGAEYLSDNVIYDAVKYWAQIYVCQNSGDTANVIAPFKQFVGNARIRLHLATIDPNGNPTKGVVHDHSYLTTVADDQAKYNQWPQNKYINLWFINTFGAASTGAAAYAYYPSTASFMPYYDGVIGLYTYINYDMAIPHELGHVLNLQHVWGNSNNPEVACGNDQVDDTPPTKGHLPAGCTAAALYDTTCASGYVKHYTAVGGGDSLVNYPDTVNSQNIMDYTYCQKMFTKGQCVRMRNALTGTTASRNNLITAANLAATGALAPMPDLPPVADFSVEKATGSGLITDNRTVFLSLTSGGSFQFRNRSWNDTISSIFWSFSNNPTTATSTTTGIVYNQFKQPGWVIVKIAAQSNAGSDTLTNVHAVYVADTAATGGLGYYQSFSSPGSVDNWPMYNYFDNQYQWQYYTGASYDGDNACIRYRSRDTTAKHVATPLGDHDDFFTPAFNLTGLSGNAYLNFKTSSAASSTSGVDNPMGDSLEIDVTINGGLKWTKLIGYKRGTLVNNGTKTSEFVPTLANQWIARGVQIPSADFTANTYFRFRYWPGSTGNNFYMDNLSIDNFPAEVADIAKSDAAVKILPNPASNGCSVMVKCGHDGTARILVKDITGRTVYQAAQTGTPGENVKVDIAREMTPAAGIYFVTAIVDGNTATEKLVVY